MGITNQEVTIGNHGLVGVGDSGDGRIGVGFTTEPEVGTAGIERQQVDGRSRASRDDAEGSIGAIGLLGAGDGSHKRGESEKGGELHFEGERIGLILRMRNLSTEKKIRGDPSGSYINMGRKRDLLRQLHKRIQSENCCDRH